MASSMKIDWSFFMCYKVICLFRLKIMSISVFIDNEQRPFISIY